MLKYCSRDCEGAMVGTGDMDATNLAKSLTECVQRCEEKLFHNCHFPNLYSVCCYVFIVIYFDVLIGCYFPDKAEGRVVNSCPKSVLPVRIGKS